MDAPIPFVLFSGLAIAIMIATGVPAIKRLTLALEGQYEFKGDSMTRRSRLGGFMWFGGWLLAGVVTSSFFFDWLLSGSLDYAFVMLGYKLEIVLHILSEMSDD